MWHPSFAIGHEQIDQEHRNLFDRLEQLLHAVVEGRDAAEVVELMEFLDRYVKEHFAHEEEIMTLNGYDGLAEQKTMHRKFMRDVELLKQELGRKESYDSALSDLVAKLTEWLTGHVLETDQRLAAFLQEKGIT